MTLIRWDIRLNVSLWVVVLPVVMHEAFDLISLFSPTSELVLVTRILEFELFFVYLSRV